MLSVGLKNEMRRQYFAQLRAAADTPVRMLKWNFERLAYPSHRHLNFKGDPRDLDQVTQLMLDAVKKLLRLWSYTASADRDDLDEIGKELGMSLKIADDSEGTRSFWKWWSMMLAHEVTPVYRFLEQNGFSWPAGGVTLQFIGHEKDEVPYVRFK